MSVCPPWSRPHTGGGYQKLRAWTRRLSWVIPQSLDYYLLMRRCEIRLYYSPSRDEVLECQEFEGRLCYWSDHRTLDPSVPSDVVGPLSYEQFVGYVAGYDAEAR